MWLFDTNQQTDVTELYYMRHYFCTSAANAVAVFNLLLLIKSPEWQQTDEYQLHTFVPLPLCTMHSELASKIPHRHRFNQGNSVYGLYRGLKIRLESKEN